MAARIGSRRNKIDRRCFLLGAVAIRDDGTIVHSRNGSGFEKTPIAHAETRLSKKIDVGSIVFVARVTRDGKWAMAKPCFNCERVLRNVGVSKIFYTIFHTKYGCITF